MSDINPTASRSRDETDPSQTQGSDQMNFRRYLPYSVVVLMPARASRELMDKVQRAMAQALDGEDDPPVVTLVQANAAESMPLSVEEPTGGPGAAPLGLGPVITIATKIADVLIDAAAREVRQQQQVEHRAQNAHQRDVESYHQRAENWRNKTFG